METTKEKGDINQEVFDKACRIAHAAPGFCDAWEVYHDLMAAATQKCQRDGDDRP